MKNHKSKKSVNKGFPTWGWVILAVVLLAIIAGVVIQQMKPPEVVYPAEISTAQAADKRSQGAFILDVRELSEWTQFHIPGATLIPLGELPNRLNEVPKDKDVIVVCRTGHRSAQGRDILRAAGFNRVTSMAGGVTEWQAQGLPVATGQ
jgi:rhodanese-related sulfurtransferase